MTAGSSGADLVCPDCGRKARPGQELCTCGFPLMLLPAPEQPHRAVARAPGERAEPEPDTEDARITQPLPRVLPVAPAVRSDALLCASCGESNSPDRTWCARCGDPLRPAPPPAAAPPPYVAPDQPLWRRLVLPVLALLVVVAAVVLGYRALSDRADETVVAEPSATPASSIPSAVAEAVPVPPASVSAQASSTRAGEQYDVRLTLDGAADTAWNSAGPQREGSVLVYTFDEPRHIVGVSVVNGWVRVSPRFGDLFDKNHRVAELSLQSDEERTSWTLADSRDRQRLDHDLGTTSRVTLVVESTYPGSEYEDVALAEVQFWAVPEAAEGG